MKTYKITLPESRIVRSAGGNVPVKSYYSHEWESLSEFFDEEPTNQVNRDKWRRWKRFRGYGRSWYDFNLTGPQLIAAFEKNEGDAPARMLHTMERMGDMIEQALPEQDIGTGTVRRRKRRRADMGNSVDIHDVRQGRLDRAWEQTYKVERETPTRRKVHIVVNLATSAGISCNDALWRGAVALRLHDMLVRRGKHVSMYAGAVWRGNYRRRSGREINVYNVPIKQSQFMLSREHLAMQVSASFSRLYVMAKAQNLHPTLTPGDGYGYPCDDYYIVPATLQERREAGEHVVVVGGAYSQRSAVNLTKKVMKQIADKDARPLGLTAAENMSFFEREVV